MTPARIVDSGPADLLLRCLSAPVGTAISDQVGRGSPNDWNEVVTEAVHCGLAPLLLERLKERDARALVPVDVWERLRRAYFASAYINMRRYGGLRTVLRCLRSSRIKVIVLKGAFLAEAVYGDVALRPMRDADLLVPRADLARTQKVLEGTGHGQRQCHDIEPFSTAKKHHLPAFCDGNLMVEIHWTIASPTGPFRIDAAGLWERARPATIAGVDMLALSPEDLLLHLCLHVTHQHGLRCGLQPFCDIAEAIRHYGSELGWSRFVDRANEWGAARYAGLTLHLARGLLAVPVSDDVLGQLVPGGLDSEVFEAARETVITQTPYDEWLSPAYLGLRGREPLAHKVKLLWERVFLSRDAMLTEYPASRDSRHPYIYHVRRLGHIMRKWGPALRMMLSHEWERSLSRNASLADWLTSRKP